MVNDEEIFTKLLTRKNIKPSVEEDTTFTKLIFTFYGDKGVGKTSAALSLPGTHNVISLDRKTKRIKDQLVAKDPSAVSRIHVYDGVKFITGDKDNITEDSFITLQYIKKILKEMPESDWVVIDGTEILVKIAENSMRYVNRLEPFKGFSDFSAWKLRNAYVAEVHKMAYDKAKVGLIYTVYADYISKVSEKGITETVEHPKWFDDIKWETDIVVHIMSRLHADNKTVSHYATIISSKMDILLRTGDVIDISNYLSLISKEQIEKYMVYKPPITLQNFVATSESNGSKI
jgi:hypothetical protein